MSKFLITLALLGAAATQAQTLDRVEVMGHKVRTDVSRACPSIQHNLVRALAPAVHRAQKEGSYMVSFSLDGERVGEVQTAMSTPDEYRRPLRHAVLGTDCQDAAAKQSPQRFGFIVDVRMEESVRGGSPRVALGVRAID